MTGWVWSMANFGTSTIWPSACWAGSIPAARWPRMVTRMPCPIFSPTRLRRVVLDLLSRNNALCVQLLELVCERLRYTSGVIEDSLHRAVRFEQGAQLGLGRAVG